MIYVFKCEDCGEYTDVVRKIEDRDEKLQCENCFSDNTKRVIGKGVKVWHPTKGL